MDEVIEGQRFRDVTLTMFGCAPPVWVVSQIFVGGVDGIRYARVYGASSQHERKTLATTVLRDKKRFLQVK
jgi:hypothetical protein